MTTTEAPGYTPIAILFGLIGLALHLTLGFLVIVSGLVAPLWAVGMMGAAWLAAFVYGAINWRGSIKKALLIPIASWAVYVGVLTFGDAVLGWTA
ncbi:MAG: hypothetical protein HKN07_11275 [Acidimicrobiia bacterium]|nr:hypothetical protein [Acidimicrobiia bacterium]